MTNEEELESDVTTRQRSKVERIIQEYDLSGMGNELVASWISEGDEQRSLRELADYVNRELLRAAMEDADIDSLEGEVDNIY